MIGGVVAIVFCDIELKQFRYREPPDCKQNGTGQRLPNGEVIFRRQKIKAEGQNNKGDGRKGEIERRDPFLKRNLQLQIYFRDTGQRLTENNGVETNKNRDPEPE